VVEEQHEPTTQTRRFSEDTELPEDGRAVVIDPFSRELAVCIEGIHTAQRELESPAGCGKAAPFPLVRSPNHAFDDDGFAGDVLLRDDDLEVGKGPEQLLVEGLNRFPSRVVLVPRLIVVPGRRPKRFHDGAQVVRILETDVLPDGRDPLARRFSCHHVRATAGSGRPTPSFELCARLLQRLSDPGLPV